MQFNIIKLLGLVGALATACYQALNGNVVEGAGIVAAALSSANIRRNM